MRTFVIAALIIGAASVIPREAKAQYAPWCAGYDLTGSSNCGFYTFAQCQADISGIGGWCYRNPAAGARASRRKPSYRYYR
jgi:hypothetical protein